VPEVAEAVVSDEMEAVVSVVAEAELPEIADAIVSDLTEAVPSLSVLAPALSVSVAALSALVPASQLFGECFASCLYRLSSFFTPRRLFLAC